MVSRHVPARLRTQEQTLGAGLGTRVQHSWAFRSFTDIESTKSFRGAAAPTGMVHSSSSVTVENGLCAAEKAVEGLVRGAVRFPTRSFFASLRPR
jgi:hypothetical protein